MNHNLKNKMEEIYGQPDETKIPWNLPDVPELLEDIVNSAIISPCKTLEIACGTGTNSIYFAEQGFDITGIDLAQAAVELACRKAVQAGVKARFLQKDILNDSPADLGQYDFIFDWNFLQHVYPNNRPYFVETISNLLTPGAKYLSVFFSDDNPQFGAEGKFRTTPIGTKLYFSSEKEVRCLFEPLFNVLDLKTVQIKGKNGPHKSIYLLGEKKD